MLIVQYTQKGGCSFADGEVLDAVRKDWAEAQRQASFKVRGLGQDMGINGTYRRDVSSTLYIDALRLLISRGEIDHKKVTILYRKTNISDTRMSTVFTLNSDGGGRLDNWPEGFCDVHEEFLTELAGWK